MFDEPAYRKANRPGPEGPGRSLFARAALSPAGDKPLKAHASRLHQLPTPYRLGAGILAITVSPRPASLAWLCMVQKSRRLSPSTTVQL